MTKEEKYKAALEEIRDIAKVSEGRAAEFYGMLAEKALKSEDG